MQEYKIPFFYTFCKSLNISNHWAIFLFIIYKNTQQIQVWPVLLFSFGAKYDVTHMPFYLMQIGLVIEHFPWLIEMFRSMWLRFLVECWVLRVFGWSAYLSHEKSPHEKSGAVSLGDRGGLSETLTLAILPPMYLFAHLYYTDIASVTMTLAMLNFSIKHRHGTATIFGRNLFGLDHMNESFLTRSLDPLIWL